MNEAETRAELIDPKLKESGWGAEDGVIICCWSVHNTETVA